jgi:hypothetical protein
MEHECCSGAGFNATIFKDSHGKTLVDRSYSFCGYESFCHVFGEAKSLDEFYKYVEGEHALRLIEAPLRVCSVRWF